MPNTLRNPLKSRLLGSLVVSSWCVPVYTCIKREIIWELFDMECIRKILIFDWTVQCNLTDNIWHLSLRVGHQCLSCCPEREGQQGNMHAL